MTKKKEPLSEEQIKNFYQANVRLSILYTMPDFCESIMKDLEDYQKKAGFQLRYEQKMYWKKLLENIYNLRKVMRDISVEQEVSYGDTCDILRRLILTAIDRCSDNDIPLMFRFINFIESFPSKRNIEIK